MKYAIETNSLTKRYGDFLAVDALDMKVKNKSVFGFLGPNGAGKTTTIKMLTCLIQSTAGTAQVAGYDINKNPNEVRKKIGMVPQLVSLYGDLTAKENVELCADYYGIPKEEKYERINELMELVDIKYAENKLVKQMSGGQKQKVSVVASLIHKPDVLFLDEPTIGLDPTTKMVLWELISELNDNGHTIILCSHDMYEVELLCDNIGIMNQGELVAYDTPQGLKDVLIKEKEDSLLSEVKTKNVQIENVTGEIDSNTYFQKSSNFNKSSKQVSLMVKNLNEKMVEDVKELNVVYNVNYNESGRLTANINEFAEDGVNNIIWTIIKNNGNITSINTKDPSLEDVFIRLTSKAPNDISNINKED